jgi:type IV secretory pathway VirB4 component
VTFSFFDSTVAPHGIIAGVSGSGKSVLANNLILSAARRGARGVRARSGQTAIGSLRDDRGTYIAFDPKSPRSINPCGSAWTKRKKIFLTDILCEMCSQGQRE